MAKLKKKPLPPEEAYYWKTWRRLCAKEGISQSDVQARHDLHRQALGYDKSHKAFSHKEYDLVFDVMRKRLRGLIPHPASKESVAAWSTPSTTPPRRPTSSTSPATNLLSTKTGATSPPNPSASSESLSPNAPAPKQTKESPSSTAHTLNVDTTESKILPLRGSRES